MTLGEIKADGYTLTAHCGNRDCGHGEPLPLDKLIDRYGPAYSVVGERRIGSSCRCVVCGHKGAVLTLTPPVATQYASSHSGWGMPPR